MNDRPAFASVRDWCAMTGMGQRATFDAIHRGDIPASRLGNRKLLIDVDAGLAWMRSLRGGIRQGDAKCGEVSQCVVETTV